MLKKKVIYLLLILAPALKGQDIHFSLFNEMPININPALLGIKEHKMQAGVLYRNQWNSVASPFNSTGAFGEYRWEPTKFLQGHTFGFGLQFLNDISGGGALQKNQLAGAVNYIKPLGKKKQHLVAGALKLMYFQRSVDVTNLAFASDFNYANGSFTSVGGNEELSGIKNNTSTMDLGLGLSYTYFNKKGKATTAGLSFDHLTQPNISFDNGDEVLSLKTGFYVISNFDLGKKASLKPTLLYNNQQEASFFIAGTEMIYPVGRALLENTDIRIGMYYRVDDAVYFTFGINHDNWSILFAYDFTTSNLGEAAQNVNAFEICINIRNRLFQPNKIKYIIPGNRFF